MTKHLQFASIIFLLTITAETGTTGTLPVMGDVVRTINNVSIPSDFPTFDIVQTGETGPGKIFYASTYGDLGNYLIILENDGTPYWYHKYPGSSNFWMESSLDFSLQPAGMLSSFLSNPGRFIVIDSNYQAVDSFTVKQYNETNFHDFALFEDGHALLIANDTRTMDISSIVSGGSKEAKIIVQIIQEQDENHTVVREWSGLDYYNIADAVHEDLKSKIASLDYAHVNSIAVDYDGHLIVSARNMSEVTKINRITKEVIWRLGGLHNQFTWINESKEFSYQHHARPIPGKPNHYTIFDNGKYKTPLYSRAVEYQIDPVAMTAEKVWEFRMTPDRITDIMGSVQRLSNGNTFIDWSEYPPGFSCEVDSNNQIVYQIQMNGTSSYRAGRYEWNAIAKEPYLIVESYSAGLALIFNKFGDPDISRYRIYGDTHPNPTTLVASTEKTYAFISDIQNNAIWYFRVTAVDRSGNESGYSNEVEVLTSFTMPGENMVRNGNFIHGETDWELVLENGAKATGSVTSQGLYHIDIQSAGSSYNDIILKQPEMKLVEGKTYRFDFDAFGERNRVIQGRLIKASAPWTDYDESGYTYLQPRSQHYSFQFTMNHPTDLNTDIQFCCGLESSDIYLSNIVLTEVRTTAVENRTDIPVNFALSQNYPNPFNPKTVISFDLPVDAFTTLTVYNISGQTVAQPICGNKKAGRHAIPFDGTNLPDGVYFYTLRIKDDIQTRKMILIK